MPKHANRAGRTAASRLAGSVAATMGMARRTGVVALSSLGLAGGTAYAVPPLNTYYGPGLPVDNYFPEGIPGSQDEPGVTVRTRLRPEYDTQGVQAGAFVIRPSFEEEAGYNTNVVGGSIDGKGSSELRSSASGSVNSNYNEDNFGLTANVNDVRYWDVPRMSHTDYNVSFGGGLNLGRDVLYLSVSYQNANEEPYDIGTQGSSIVQLNKPLNFSDTDFRVSYSTEFGRFTVKPNVDYQLIRFASGDFTGITTDEARAFDQRLRDSNILQGGVVARYEFQPQRDAVLVLNGNYNNYIRGGNQADIGVVNSTGVTVLTGLDYQLSGATTLRALVGYQQRFFNGNTSNQGAPIGELQAIWNPTGLTTVTAAYARTIEDATTDTVTGYTYDRLKLVVDHELYRNILLQASGLLEAANYQGSSLEQTNVGFGLGATYLVNRNIQLALSYNFIDHLNSSGFINPVVAQQLGGVSDSFSQHIILLRFRFGL